MPGRDPQSLTPREREVLPLIRRGLTNEEIAERLGITLDGAKYHVSQILSKLGVETREAAAAWTQEQRRRWWVGWPLAAKAAGATIAVVAVAGLGVLAWGVVGTGIRDKSAPAVADLAAAKVSFRVCASDPNWARPSFDWIASDANPMYYYIKGASVESIRAGYERRIYEVVPGNSVNLGWLSSSGLIGAIDPAGCPNAVERQRANGRLALYTLAQFEPVLATRDGDRVTITVRESERGWSDLLLTLDPPLGADYKVSFVDDRGRVVVSYPPTP